MLQNKHLAFEPHFLCEICGEAVTNPLCPICLATEVDAWSTFYPNLRSGLLPKIKKYLERIKESIINSTECIKCKRAQTSICPYCFIDFVEGEIKKLESNNFILNEFREFFDFDTQIPDVHKAKWGRYPE
ncbi:MAG: hypothetical protein WCX73_04685 [Candidatus Pacearchaeota archaeon]|jgi:hypothetical protein